MSEKFLNKPFDMVIFGGTGDLARRKLLPSLYRRDYHTQICNDARIVCVARQDISREEFLSLVRESLLQFIKESEFGEPDWKQFSQCLHYIKLDIVIAEDWKSLTHFLNQQPDHVRIFYLATLPDLYSTVVSMLSGNTLINDNSRIVLEKPVGSDLPSAEAINADIAEAFQEEQIFRTDHYLGKETVQNLTALRFGNSLFEPLWRNGTIDHVQITVAEEIGVGTRGQFYEDIGALRDMVQNHMLQLLCLIAMEPPSTFDNNQIRTEKLKVLQALRPITKTEVKEKTVRGQYRAGTMNGKPVQGYIDDLAETRSSNTETFVALKVQIDNWRWSNTPFYLCTGKRLAAKVSEIVIQFSPVAHSIFPDDAGELKANNLVIRLEPDEGIMLSLMSKQPGPAGFKLRSIPLNLSFNQVYQERYPDAYERLLIDVIRGEPALFVRRDEVELAWQWIDELIRGWATAGMDVKGYVAGSWGPADAAVLIARDHRTWHYALDYQ